jgi:hypothetical protein
VAASALTASPTRAAAAESAWREITSEHFMVRTDLDTATSGELVATLEETRTALLTMLWGRAPGPPGRLQVIAFASDKELSETAGKPRGNALTTMPPFPPALVLGGFGSDGERRSAKHELTHYLIEWFMPLAPRWYHEGLACFAESVRYESRERKAYLGEPSPGRLRMLANGGLLPVAELFRKPPPWGPDYGRYLVTCWVLVHNLIDRRYAAFARFEGRLAKSESVEAAWAAEFPDLVDPVALQAQLQKYVPARISWIAPASLGPWQGHLVTRPLSVGEEYAARAFVAASSGLASEFDTAARAHVSRALTADPSQIEAVAIAAYARGLSRDAKRALVDQARSAYPQSWLAWLLTAQLASDPLGPVARAALAQAAALDAAQPGVLFEQAIRAGLDGDWARALALSGQGLPRGTNGRPGLIFHAVALAYAGACPESTAVSSTLRQSFDPHDLDVLAALRPVLDQVCAEARRKLPACAPDAGSIALSHGATGADGGPPGLAQTGDGDLSRRVRDSGLVDAFRRLIDPDMRFLAAVQEIELDVTTDAAGAPTEVCIEHSSGFGFLDRAATIIVRRLLPPIASPSPPVDGPRRTRLRLRLSAAVDRR